MGIEPSLRTTSDWPPVPSWAIGASMGRTLRCSSHIISSPIPTLADSATAVNKYHSRGADPDCYYLNFVVLPVAYRRGIVLQYPQREVPRDRCEVR